MLVPVAMTTNRRKMIVVCALYFWIEGKLKKTKWAFLVLFNLMDGIQLYNRTQPQQKFRKVVGTRAERVERNRKSCFGLKQINNNNNNKI